MCSPTAFMALSGGISALSSLSAGNFSDQIGKANQAARNKQAEGVIAAGQVEEQQYRYGVADLKGKQKTSFAASGVDISSGSPVDILSDTAAIGELDALTIRSNAATEASNIRQIGSNERLQGKLAKRQSRGQAAGTLLTTGGSIAAL